MIHKPHQNFLELLEDKSKTFEEIISLKDFFHFWSKNELKLENYILNHYEDLIEVGFQLKKESVNSIRCLQIMSSQKYNFRHKLFNHTKFLNFVHDYLFNLSTYPIYSQKNYFYVLPNLMIDLKFFLIPIFDDRYFNELFKNMENDFAYNFILRIIEFAPKSIEKVLKQIDLEKIIVNNLLENNSKENQSKQSKILLIRNQILFKKLVESDFEADLNFVLTDHITDVINNAIENPTAECLSFLCYLNEVSLKKTTVPRWRKIHLKINPYISTFCEIILKSNSQKFTPLFDSCIILSLSIITTTKEVPMSFIDLFKYLTPMFFTLKTNTFLHNCYEKSFKLLVSLGKMSSNFLDELDLFNKITDCYENIDKCFCPFHGQLRLIAENMNKFVSNSKTVDIEKWKKLVVAKNIESEKIIKGKFGGHVPPDINEIKRFILRHKYFNPSFFSKNLLNENNQPKKFRINSPLY